MSLQELEALESEASLGHVHAVAAAPGPAVDEGQVSGGSAEGGPNVADAGAAHPAAAAVDERADAQQVSDADQDEEAEKEEADDTDAKRRRTS